MAKRCLVLGLYIACISCFTPAKAASPSPYQGPWVRTVLIDPTFSAKERDEIIRGLGLWAKPLGPQNMLLAYAPLGYRVSPGVPIIRVVRVEDYELDRICRAPGKIACWHKESVSIYVGTPRIRVEMMAKVTAHEIGHAAGLDHAPGAGSIMSETVEVMPDAPTRTDVERFCEVNGCRW